MNETWGWNFPALDRHSLSRVATDFAEEIRTYGSETLDTPVLKIVKDGITGVDRIKTTTLPHFFDGNGAQAVPAFLSTISRLRSDLESLLGWQSIRDTTSLPPKLARRIRAYQAELDQIAPDKDELQKQISLIKEATSAAETLPTDLEALGNARKKIEDIQGKSTVMHEKISGHLKDVAAASDTISNLQTEASKLVAKCEEAYRITTTKGLAAAFDQRAKHLAVSMWVWVVVLVGSLTAGYFLGASRLKAITDILNSQSQQNGVVWPNAVLAFFSLGAPIWLAWIATKQIGQRFRLAEDYAFKATAKAYEGYRKEAARIDKDFEARLFGSALTRLEEAPLRLVESKTPGSPWHEFVESEAFLEAVKTIPGLRDQFNKLQKKTSTNGGDGGTDQQLLEPVKRTTKLGG